MAGDGTIIIKRIKKGGHGGHHGGAWKVAYADFVTAMMAFFLLMWLINTTTPEQKRGIADYFAAQNISKSTSGAGGVLAGKVFGDEGARAGGSMSTVNKAPPPKPQQSASKAQSQAKGGGGESQVIAAQNQQKSDDKVERQLPSEEHRQFEQAMQSLRQALQQMPDIAELSRSIMMNVTPNGLNIQLVDETGQAMFQPGTANLYPKTRILLQQVAKIVDRLPNRIAITGHTDAAPFTGAGGMTNWELSAARANTARAVLASEGIESDRIFEVSGKAGTDPLLPDDPYASSNRRISILLMSEAPVVPPGLQL
jgi:chemotaxis protein MotB